MKSIFILLNLIVMVVAAYAQTGEIRGKVVDENGQGIPFANAVIVDSKGAPTGIGTTTDFDGNYSLKSLSPGRYNVQFSYVGYESQIQRGIGIDTSKIALIDIKLKPHTSYYDTWDGGQRPPTIIPGPHKFKFSLAEERDSTGSNYTLNIRTERLFKEGGYWINASLKREKSNIIIRIHGVAKDQPGEGEVYITTWREYPATARLRIGRLPIGTYKIRVIYDSIAISGSIKIKDAEGIFTVKGGMASMDQVQKFTRIPSNTLWGYVLYASKQDSSILLDYLQLLKNLGGRKKKLPEGNYPAFQIDKNEKFIASRSHGWVCEYGFILDYNRNFEDLKELTRNFIHEKGDDKVDIILYNDKGEWFSEVR